MPRIFRLNGGLLGVWALALVLAAVGFWIASRYVKPAPPDRVVLATGGVDGAYHAWGQTLVPLLADERIELILRPTAGSAENAGLLATGEVDLAIIQGGTELAEGTRGLASLFFEGVWLFHHVDQPITRLDQLRRHRVSLGPDGSGTRALALDLLALNGLDGASWPALDATGALEELRVGTLDAAFVVASERASTVQAFLDAPFVRVADLERTEAFHLQRRHLAVLELPEGAVDLSVNVPQQPTRLPGVAAMLVGGEDLHPAIIDLVLIEARKLDRESLFAIAGTFPSPDHLSLPLDPGAARFHERGPSFLQRYLPFWAATLIDRAIVLLLPLVALVIPMAKALPPVYRWRVRSRIYRWYDDLQMLERRIQTDPDAAGLHAMADRIEAEVDQVHTPLSYADELYHLKLHIDLVRKRIVDRSDHQETTT